jgi:hypothetical protein
MRALREVGVTLVIMLTGAVLGAFAGATVFTAALFAYELRQGRTVLPLSWVGAFVAAVFGGLFGAVLAPIVAFAPCRHVPVGRLFHVLTSRTIIGGSGVALLLPHPVVALLGGLIGFCTGVEHLRIKEPETEERPDESHAPAG